MAQNHLPFQYKEEKNNACLTGFAGLPLYVELAIQSGFVEYLQQTVHTKTQGWTDAETILSLILLNLAGGEGISDIERLERDSGLRTLLLRMSTHGMKRQERRDHEKRWRRTKSRGLPSNAAIHRYLPQFHSAEEETKREQSVAFIPKPNDKLSALLRLNIPLIEAAQRYHPSKTATFDQDATLTATYKREAFYCYKGYKAYQPFNTYWAEHGILVHSEFRDGNVNAGFEQLRVLEESLALLPLTVEQVFLRSDSAGYQEALLRYCAEGKSARFGVIEFVIAAKVCASMRQEAQSIEGKHWEPIYQVDEEGDKIKTNQEWTDICYVPDWAVKSKGNYRYLAIREPMSSLETSGTEELDLPFQTIETKENRYKLFVVVTNRKTPGSELIQWHRKRCGKSEQVHNTQKEGLAGGVLPSNLFGVNAAWWQLMVLAFNLSRLMQLTVLPEGFKESKMKSLRLHIIQLPGRVIYHARQVYLRVESSSYELYQAMRKKIAQLTPGNYGVIPTG